MPTHSLAPTPTAPTPTTPTPTTTAPTTTAPVENNPSSAAPAPPPRSPRQRRWLSPVLVILALLAGGSVFALLASYKQEPPREEPLPRSYNVVAFEVSDVRLREIVSAFGTARSNQVVTIAAEVAGTIIETHNLQEGVRVEGPSIARHANTPSVHSSGDTLLQIDPRPYEERLVQAEKMLAQDDVDLRLLKQTKRNNERLLESVTESYRTAKEDYDKQVGLRQRGAGTEAGVRQAELAMRQYEDKRIGIENELSMFDLQREQLTTRRDSHRSSLEMSQMDLDHTQVHAPFDGRISRVLIEQGQYVRPGEPLLEVTNNSRVEIPVAIALSAFATIAARLDAGESLPVQLAPNETADARWQGIVTRYAPMADEQSRTVDLFVEVDNREQAIPLLPGTFVNARIEGTTITSQSVIPRDAILNGELFVAQPLEDQDAFRIERRAVTIKRTLQSLAVVGDVVSPGERVILTNLDVLTGINPDEPQPLLTISDVTTIANEIARQRTTTVRVIE